MLKIKNLINKLCLATLFTFSLPFLVHGSSFEMPKDQKKLCHLRGETEHLETDIIIQKIIRKNFSDA